VRFLYCARRNGEGESFCSTSAEKRDVFASRHLQGLPSRFDTSAWAVDCEQQYGYPVSRISAAGLGLPI
jgi:hypothetical protein